MSRIDDLGTPAEGQEPGESGAVGQYLDEMFDRLAGTGGAGRRALSEAEDHLRAAVADGLAHGLPATQAEQQAVARFGSPARIAGELRRTYRRAGLWSVISGGWLLAGLVVVVVAAGSLVKALELAVLVGRTPEPWPPCADALPVPVVPAGTGTCSLTKAALYGNLIDGLVLLLLAVAVFLGRRLAMGLAGLAPAPRRFPLVAGAALTLAGLAVPMQPWMPFDVLPTDGGQVLMSEGGLLIVPMGAEPQLITGGVALVAAAGCVAWYAMRARRRAAVHATG
jgi:hypothetical protein